MKIFEQNSSFFKLTLTGTISKYNGPAGKVSIPSHIGNHAITRIGPFAFANRNETVKGS